MRHGFWMFVLSILFFMVGVSYGSTTITVSPSVAPNIFGSPSWSGYVANAMTGLQSNTNVVGNRAVDPTGYIGGLTQINPSGIEVTSFPSWDGVANPTGAFAAELGNRLHFGLKVISTVKFSLSQVDYDIVSNDVGNDLGFTGNLSGTDFGSGTRIGLSYGPDGVLGGGDDVLYNVGNPGNSATLINELYYVGVGNAEWPGDGIPDPGTLLGRQALIDTTTNWILNNITSVTGTYSIDFGPGGVSPSGSASVAVRPVPLPASVWTGLVLMSLLVGGGLARKHVGLKFGTA